MLQWVDQPVGAGFSKGNVTATDENDVAEQFLGFWKNFIDTFSMQGYKVYVTGSSYAGMYTSYIASAMLDRNDTDYFNVSGLQVRLLGFFFCHLSASARKPWSFFPLGQVSVRSFATQRG